MAGRKEGAFFDEAESLYVQENKTPEQISGILPVSQNTLYKWRDKGGWEAKRKAALANPRSLSETLMVRLEALVQAFQVKEGMTADELMALPKIGNSICQTVAALEKLGKSHDLKSLAIPVMSKYADFLKKPELQISTGEMLIHQNRMRAFFESLE